MQSFRTIYLSIIPKIKDTFENEWANCLENLVNQTALSQGEIYKITLFIDSENEVEFLKRKKFIKQSLYKYYASSCPTFSVLSQSPEGDTKIACEAVLLKSEAGTLSYKILLDLPYIVIESSDYKEIWMSGIEANEGFISTEFAARTAFEMMHRVLEIEGMRFEHIVRQWNYIGGILQNHSTSSGILQNYQTFNEVRHSYYKQYRKTEEFPAATGIGIKYEGIIIDFCAIRSDTNSCYAIKSPVQKNPYEYSQEVLVGEPLPNLTIKHPPEFERAILQSTPNFQRLFVSGTAAISGQNSVEKNDAQRQTKITIENIRKLICIENLFRFYPNCESLKCYNFVRVYVKNRSDLESVGKICRKEFGGTPMLIVQADICRDDLLVEIEAELGNTI